VERSGAVCEDGRVAAESEHGPLPRLPIGLMVVTGLVDAFTHATLDHMFVADMTGKVVFFGFAVVFFGFALLLGRATGGYPGARRPRSTAWR
jgi:hypothetical protein